MDLPQEEELQERIHQIADEIKSKHFEETLQMYMIQSREAAALRLEQILRKFDKHSAEGYDIKDMAHLEADLRDLLVSKLSQNSNKNFSEAKFGSERTTVFLDALKLRVPNLYT